MVPLARVPRDFRDFNPAVLRPLNAKAGCGEPVTAPAEKSSGKRLKKSPKTLNAKTASRPIPTPVGKFSVERPELSTRAVGEPNVLSGPRMQHKPSESVTPRSELGKNVRSSWDWVLLCVGGASSSRLFKSAAGAVLILQMAPP